MKRLFFILMAVTLVLGLVWLGCEKQPPTTPEGGQEQGSLSKAGAGGPEFAPGRVLAEFSPRADVPGIYRRYGVSEIGEIPGLNVKILRVPEKTVEKVVAALNRNPNVVFAEPDHTYHAVEIPNDTHFGSQWGLHNTNDHDIDAPEALDVTTGVVSDKIAVLDTGVDQNHEDLISKLVDNKNFTDSPTVDDMYGHGTHVAGIAAAATHNTVGIAGTAPECGIMNGKVLGDDGGGYASWIASGMSWAVDNGAKVINMSLGSYSASRTMQKAVRSAWNRGVVIVAAAGNDNVNLRHYPAAYSQCIAVAATNQSDLKASFSNYGSWVDVAAPGVNIWSTLPNHPYVIRDEYGTSLNYDDLGGTSMASPFVAGIAGLVWSTSYGTSNESVRARIESTCDVIAGTGTYWAYGRANAHEAVMGSPPPPPPPPTINVTVLGVDAVDMPKGGDYNITARIKNEGTDPVTIHVECKVQTPNGRGRKQNLTVQEFTLGTGATVDVTWNDASKLNKGSYIAVVTVQEDSDVGTNNTDGFVIY